MAKKKTSKKQKKFSIYDMEIHDPGPNFKSTPYDPDVKLRDVKFIAGALIEALLLGDKKSFVEILEAHIKAKNISEVMRKTKLSRSTIYAAISQKGNPTLDTIFSLIHKSA